MAMSATGITDAREVVLLIDTAGLDTAHDICLASLRLLTAISRSGTVQWRFKFFSSARPVSASPRKRDLPRHFDRTSFNAFCRRLYGLAERSDGDGLDSAVSAAAAGNNKKVPLLKKSQWSMAVASAIKEAIYDFDNGVGDIRETVKRRTGRRRTYLLAYVLTYLLTYLLTTR